MSEMRLGTGHGPIAIGIGPQYPTPSLWRRKCWPAGSSARGCSSAQTGRDGSPSPALRIYSFVHFARSRDPSGVGENRKNRANELLKTKIVMHHQALASSGKTQSGAAPSQYQHRRKSRNFDEQTIENANLLHDQALVRTVKIATFNINNVNKRLANLLDWLREAEPDVVSLQELKAADKEFPRAAIEKAGYGIALRGQKIVERRRDPRPRRRAHRHADRAAGRSQRTSRAATSRPRSTA